MASAGRGQRFAWGSRRLVGGAGVTARRLLLRAAAALMGAAAAAVGCAGAETDEDSGSVAATSNARTVSVAFYAHYAPVSSSLDPRPGTAGFDLHAGYEADLLDAVEAMPGIGVTFLRHGVDDWGGIWLLPAAEGIDMACGGITIDPGRTRGPDGEVAVRFTDGHIEFRQSLLVRAADASRLDAYGALDGDDTVGVQTATTGESRLLQLIGVADDDGRLAAGTTVVIDAEGSGAGSSVVEATAGSDLRISPGGASAGLDGRTLLIPADPSKPEVVYLDRLRSPGLDTADTSESQLDALRNGTVDAIAQGIVETTAAAAAYGDEFAVSVIDERVETGGCTVDADDTDLADRMNTAMEWLTDHGEIGFEEWADNAEVFIERAAPRVESGPASATDE